MSFNSVQITRTQSRDPDNVFRYRDRISMQANKRGLIPQSNSSPNLNPQSKPNGPTSTSCPSEHQAAYTAKRVALCSRGISTQCLLRSEKCPRFFHSLLKQRRRGSIGGRDSIIPYLARARSHHRRIISFETGVAGEAGERISSPTSSNVSASLLRLLLSLDSASRRQKVEHSLKPTGRVLFASLTAGTSVVVANVHHLAFANAPALSWQGGR